MMQMKKSLDLYFGQLDTNTYRLFCAWHFKIYMYIHTHTLRCDKHDGSKGQLSAQFGCLRNCARIVGIGEKQKGLISMSLGLRSAK